MRDTRFTVVKNLSYLLPIGDFSDRKESYIHSALLCNDIIAMFITRVTRIPGYIDAIDR